jgi:hypothetical protein
MRRRARVGLVAAAAIAMVAAATAGIVAFTSGKHSGAKASSTARRDSAETAGRHLALPARTHKVNGAFTAIAAGDGRVIPLLIQPKPCAKASLWDAVHESQVKLQPWPGCRAKYHEVVRLAAGFDSYRFEDAAIAGRLVSVDALWHVSDSCEVVLNRLVLPKTEGETLGTFDSGCLFVGEFASTEKSVGALVAAGRSVAFNVWSARRGRSRRRTMSYPAIWTMTTHGAPRRLAGLKGLLVDAQRGRLLLRSGKDLVLRSEDMRGVADVRVFRHATTGALADDLVIIQEGQEAHVYDAASGEQMETWLLQQDPFQVPKNPDFAPSKTPPPVLLDAWKDLVVYASGRQIRLLRLHDGYDAVLAEGRFEKGVQQFPFLDAAIDGVGLFYAVSTSGSNDASWPYGHGTISFVGRAALERALP